MRRFCAGVHCRHRKLSEYFGQNLPDRPCEACDVCLNEIEGLENATVTAQKILSCVARHGRAFRRRTYHRRVARCRHRTHPPLGARQTHNIRADEENDRKSLTNVLYQLVDGSLLERTTGDRPVLKLNEASWAVMRGQRTVQLLQPKTKVRKSRAAEESWEGVDTGLFENLRKLRRDIAGERGVPPFVVFNDATLRDMAKIRPGSLLGLRRIRGVGERKAADLGPRFVEAITSYCTSRGLPVSAEPQAQPRKSNDAKGSAFEMFSRGESIQHVAEKTDRAPGTVCGYLVEYLQSRPDTR